MRIFVVAGLTLLAGCGLSPEWNEWKRQRDADANFQRQFAATQQANYEASAEGRADADCRYRTQAAMASYQGRTFLDLEGTARGNQLHAECMAFWRRNGRTP